MKPKVSNIISDNETYLSCLYGNSMTLLSEEERVSGHQAKVYWSPRIFLNKVYSNERKMDISHPAPR